MAQDKKFRVEGGFALVSEKEFENFRVATIERCAKVAEAGWTGIIGQHIAAAIRALKDKP
jgi:hypothetical protein